MHRSNFVGTLFCFLHVVKAQSVHLGQCPQVHVMEGLVMDKILGHWYTMVPSHDYAIIDNLQNPGQYHFIEIIRNRKLGNKFIVNELTQNSGELMMKQRTERLPRRFVVLTTDYENYLAIFTCKQVLATYKITLRLLSRKKNLEEDLLVNVCNTLEKYNLNATQICSKIPQKSSSTYTTTLPFMLLL
ncbi:hypothetical protein FQA39_LY18101 [Lamprigera yunnana]|nr:hypothetical protein FQA39_LY18101 [Lamprigera yunnana]